MTRDEAVAIVAEALRNATFRWDDPDVEQKAAEVAVDALALLRQGRRQGLREMTARADYSRDRLPEDGSIYDCDFCGAGPGDCHCGDHSDGDVTP